MSAQAELPSKAGIRAPKTVAIGLIALVGLLGADLFLHRGTLVEPISAVSQITGVVMGVGIGLFSSALAARFASKVGKDIGVVRLVVAILALPIFGGFAGSYYSRVAVEQANFYGYSPTHSEIKAEVVWMSSRRRGGPWAYVRPYPGAREIQVRINDALYNRLDPWRSPGRDCLSLQIETGRNGVRRTILPNVFDDAFGLSRLVHCDPRLVNSG